MNYIKISLFILGLFVCSPLLAMEKPEYFAPGKTKIIEEYEGVQKYKELSLLEALPAELKFQILLMLNINMNLADMGKLLKDLRLVSDTMKNFVDDYSIIAKFFAVNLYGNSSIKNQIKVLNLLNLPKKVEYFENKINDIDWLNKDFLFSIFDLIEKTTGPDKARYEKIAETTLYKNNNLIYTTDDEKNTPFHIAAKLGMYVLMGQLLKTAEKLKDTKIMDAQNIDGDTALILAMENNHPEIALMLIKNQAIDRANKKGISAADIRLKKINLLKANPSKENDYLAAQYEHLPSFIRKI